VADPGCLGNTVLPHHASKKEIDLYPALARSKSVGRSDGFRRYRGTMVATAKQGKDFSANENFEGMNGW
jgi:hypothetical protein